MLLVKPNGPLRAEAGADAYDRGSLAVVIVGVRRSSSRCCRSRSSGYHQGLAARVAIYFIAILGLNILTGYTGQISIGHGAFMAIGGYTTAILSHYHHANLIATLPASARGHVPSAALLVGLPALRLSGVYLALATFALAVSVPQLPLKFSKFLGRQQRDPERPRRVSHLWLYWSAGAALRSRFVAAWLLLRGRIGRAFRAVRDSEVAGASRRASRCRSTRPSPSASRPPSPGVAGSLFVLVTNGFAQPDEFGDPPVARSS